MALPLEYLSLKKIAEDLGADLFGVADVRRQLAECALPSALKERFERAVVIGMRVSPSVLEEITDRPTKLYYHHYRTLNAALDQAALRISQLIMRAGFYSLAIPASQIIDWEGQRAHLSHKKMGLLAGLGWLGRNNLLVNREYGCRFRMSTVLTDMPLKADAPSKQNCGECHACVAVCPASAIKEDPALFDHQACFHALKEFQRQKYVEQYICGICVKACKGLGV